MVLDGELDFLCVASDDKHRVASPFPVKLEGNEAHIKAVRGATYQIIVDGEQILDIPVTPGESVLIRVDNDGGHTHNFYIGTASQLSTPPSQEDTTAFKEAEKEAGRVVDYANQAFFPSTDVGIPNWQTGVQYVEWLVPDDITDLKFGCTISAHYRTMQGTFSVRA